MGKVECQSKSVQPVWKLPPVYSHVMQRYQKPDDLKWIFRHENVFTLIEVFLPGFEMCVICISIYCILFCFSL